MPSSTLPSWVLECLCPGVRTTESGLPLPSQARWTLVERPPRLLPSASSNEWPSPFLDLCDSALCVLPQRAGEPAQGRVVHAHLPLDLAHRVRFGLDVGKQPIPSAIPPPAHEAVVAGLPGTVAGGQVAPGRPGPELPQDAVYGRAVVLPLLASPAVRGQKRRDTLPRLVRQLAPLYHSFSHRHHL